MRARSAVVVVLAVCGLSRPAAAVPAFARQTGLSCSLCHTVFPELTPYGRRFKAGGYAMTLIKQITDGGGTDHKRVALEIPATVPLGAMFVTGYTHTQKPQQVTEGAPPALNDSISFPQQFSLFYAGKIAPDFGAFIQITYEAPDDHFTFDNTDIRYAHAFTVGKGSFTVGGTLNNNPTVTDLWNSTPAWAPLFISSPSAPTPNASTLIDGGLGQTVAGAGVYGYYNGDLDVYLEADAYRASPLGVSQPLDSTTGATNVVSGFAPYWRLAVEKDAGENSIEVGTFGMDTTLLPGGTDASGAARPLSRPGDLYVDVGVDAQYQYIGEQNIVSAQFAYINEHRSLKSSLRFGDASVQDGNLQTVKLSGSYTWDRTLGARLTLQTVRGNNDPTLYAGEGPLSTSWTGEAYFTPWYDVRLGLMYTGYPALNGGFKDASNANTTYGYLWLAF